MAKISAADRAYAKAVKLVEEAQVSGATEIDFNTDNCRQLTRIPGGLDRVKRLVRLDFNNTKISDLSPIAGLTSLRILNLDQTGVNELSPIAGLTGLQYLSLAQTKITDLSPIA